MSAQLLVDGGNQSTYLATTITTGGLGYATRVESPDGVVDSTYRDGNRGLDTLTVRLGPQRTYNMVLFGGTKTWYSASQRVRLVYDLERNLTETHRWSSAGGLHNTLVERTRYDWANRPVARVAPDGARDSTAYDHAGNPVALVTRRGDTLTMRYDAANRLMERRAPAVSYGTGSYDGASFDALSLGADTARFHYDLMGRDTLAMNRYARITRSYFTNGRLASETQRLRNVSDLSRSVSDPAGFGSHIYTLTETYDLSGRRPRSSAIPHSWGFGPTVRPSPITRSGPWRRSPTRATRPSGSPTTGRGGSTA